VSYSNFVAKLCRWAI